ncbi:MAG TPA: YqaA family protein [Gammaproteobacteria bacterium]|jgi:membrane protein YqaA with SNARE-associated domain|nr:YqaA family protein [Gammaproteobacteria bacterium]
MKIFTGLYDKCMQWSRHRYAVRYLSVLSFAESSFFPIPPDVMLAPMSMARPERALGYAAITTLASVIGGLFGYLIGAYGFELIQPWLQESHYWEKYLHARDWFERWGFWAILVAGFSPIPYKVFTIAAGTLGMNLPLFIAGSFLGRGGRFFLVSTLMAWGGPRMEENLRVWVEWLGWAVVVLAFGAYFYFK